MLRTRTSTLVVVVVFVVIVVIVVFWWYSGTYHNLCILTNITGTKCVFIGTFTSLLEAVWLK